MAQGPVDLQVKQPLNETTAQYVSDQDGNQSLLTLTAGGPVGIGTDKPSDKLHIRDVDSGTYGIATETDGKGRGIQIVTPGYIYNQKGSTLQLGPRGEGDKGHSYLQAYTEGKTEDGILELNPHGGRVVVGKTPSAELVVHGTIKTDRIEADTLVVGTKQLAEVISAQEKEIAKLKDEVLKLKAASK